MLALLQLSDTAFKQQRIRAWRPILTPKSVLPAFIIIGVLFAPLGGLLLWASDTVSPRRQSNVTTVKSDRAGNGINYRTGRGMRRTRTGQGLGSNNHAQNQLDGRTAAPPFFLSSSFTWPVKWCGQRKKRVMRMHMRRAAFLCRQ